MDADRLKDAVSNGQKQIDKLEEGALGHCKQTGKLRKIENGSKSRTRIEEMQSSGT